jgi:hypothetical protein
VLDAGRGVELGACSVGAVGGARGVSAGGAGGATDAVSATGVGAGSTTGLGAGGFGAAFFAGTLAGAAAGKASRSRRATGASTVDDALLTNSPSSLSFARTSLLGTPSSFASSCTRALPATGLLVAGPAVTRTVPIRWETHSWLALHRVLIALRLTFVGLPNDLWRRKPTELKLTPVTNRLTRPDGGPLAIRRTREPAPDRPAQRMTTPVRTPDAARRGPRNPVPDGARLLGRMRGDGDLAAQP